MSLPKIAYGKGSRVFDQDGNEYLDASGGPAIFCIGHGDKRVNNAIMRQLDQAAQGYRAQFDSDPLEQLTQLITDRSGPEYTEMIFGTGGSEAVEASLKIALQYQQAIGEKSRTRFIARQRSYHGNTLGALSVSGYPMRRKLFEGSLVPVSFVSGANAYRPPEGVTVDEMSAFQADELEAEIVRLGPENIAAFIMEPVVGAAGCVVPPPDGYPEALANVCKRYGVLVISDEVMSGAGRIGTWRASARYNTEPDIFTSAKGLSGGYLPLGVAVYQTYIGEAIREAHGALMHGHTFTAHTTACAAAQAVQEIVRDEQLVERVAALGPWFGEQLKAAAGSHPNVGDVRGCGFFWGVELVADKANKTPFAPEQMMHAKLTSALRADGMLVYPVMQFATDGAGDGVVFSPAYNASEAELMEMAERLERGLATLD